MPNSSGKLCKWVLKNEFLVKKWLVNEAQDMWRVEVNRIVVHFQLVNTSFCIDLASLCVCALMRLHSMHYKSFRRLIKVSSSDSI